MTNTPHDSIDWSQLTPVEALPRSGAEDDAELQEMCTGAAKYIAGQEWCKAVRRTWLGDGCPGIFVVALVEIENAASPSDELLWVVDGDLPPAYFVVDELPTPKMALQMYVRERQNWVDAVLQGQSLDGVAPVNVSPTAVNATKLGARLGFLRREFLEAD